MSTALPIPGDGAKATSSVDQDAVSYPGLTLVASILATSLAFIDGSVVNVALSSIAHSFAASAAQLQWTVNAYLLPLSALLLIGGAAGDHFGRRRVFVLGIALFALASIGCAMAPNLQTLLAARAVQGMGAAMLMPNSLALLSGAFSGAARGRAIGTWAAAGAITGAIGPPLGGMLIELAGWRAIFFVNVPIAVTAIGIAMRYVEENETERQPLDWAGALLATAGLGALTWSLTQWSSHRALDIAVICAFIGGLTLLLGFVALEGARGEKAMMPLTLFGSSSFIGLTLLTFLLYGSLGGLLVLLPFTLITTGGYSPLHAGLSMLPLPVLIGIGSRLMGRVAQRFGSRWPLTIGSLIVGLGFGLLHHFDGSANYWSGVLPGIAVIALGMAAVAAPLTTAVLSSVDKSHTGTASGFNSAVARTGGMIATALAGSVIALRGHDLVAAFHGATWIATGAAIVSAVTAYRTLRMPAHAD
ncbi:MAG TPA: MFS transporter [Stellaceae bacterium]|nr:MFS transporter [Stellaceae bacterium]